MDSSVDLEALRERVVAGEISRRELLGGLGGGTLGGCVLWELLPIPWEVDAHLSSAEEQFSHLATQIDSTDLRDPLQVSGLLNDVEAAVATVESTLSQTSIDDGEQIAEQQLALDRLVSVLPGVKDPPAKSRTAQRVEALESALPYYQALIEPLKGAQSVQGELTYYESSILNGRQRPDVALSEVINPTLREQIQTTRSLGKRITGNTGVAALVPDFERAATQLEEQIQVYEEHARSLEAYLGSGEQMEAGARSYEQSHLEKAKDRFAAANGVVSASVPKAGLEYSISGSGPTLDDYRTLFQRRQQGFEILLNACSSEIDESERRQRFTAGLEHLLEARRVVE